MNSLSANYYFYIVKKLEVMGFKKSSVRSFSFLEEKIQNDPKFQIGVGYLHELFETAQSELNDPHIGLHVSDRFRISNYGHEGGIFSTCDTISDALTCAIKYGCLAHTLGRLHLARDSNTDDKYTKYIWSPHYPEDQETKFRHITECVVSNYALTIKWLSWSMNGRIENITFTHQQSDPVSEYTNVLGTNVEFESEHNSILIESKFLTTEIPTANPLKLSMLKQKLNRLLAEYNLESDLVARTEYAIKKVISKKRPTLPRIAEELLISERSLKRHLSKMNVSYREILQRVKKELCGIYLEEGVSYSEIAQLLWYADQSAFTRAYKSWYGISPTKHNGP